MRKYVALLRGIGPGNPNMRNDKLREFFEGLGLNNVQTVISSGNVLFETDLTDSKALEAKIEKALPEKLGFHSTVIIRSKEELRELVASDPFKGRQHSNQTYLFVTFPKSRIDTTLKFPHKPSDGSVVLGIHGHEICSITDTTRAKTPNLMQWLEKEFGRGITSRTYKTVERILRKFNQKG
jgi:uncharacterized protein (DUF1697 family)